MTRHLSSSKIIEPVTPYSTLQNMLNRHVPHLLKVQFALARFILATCCNSRVVQPLWMPIPIAMGVAPWCTSGSGGEASEARNRNALLPSVLGSARRNWVPMSEGNHAIILKHNCMCCVRTRTFARSPLLRRNMIRSLLAGSAVSHRALQR